MPVREGASTTRNSVQKNSRTSGDKVTNKKENDQSNENGLDVDSLMERFRASMEELLEEKLKETLDSKLSTFVSGMNDLKSSYRTLSEKVSDMCTKQERLEATVRAQDHQINVLSGELHCCTRELSRLSMRDAEDMQPTVSRTRDPRGPEGAGVSWADCVAAGMDSRNGSASGVAAIVRETTMQVERKNNVILHGVSEKQGKTWQTE